MIFDPKKLLLLAGPCSLEKRAGLPRRGGDAGEDRREAPGADQFVFKGSFDKANRTSLGGDRGTGMQEGLALLALMKQDYGFPCRDRFARATSRPPPSRRCATCYRSRRFSAARPISCSRPPRRAASST
jgi:hypothetical protein